MTPPKRTRDVLASSSVDTRTTSADTRTTSADTHITSTGLATAAAAPYSSKDPLLPTVGPASKHSSTRPAPQNSKKRKRPPPGHTVDASDGKPDAVESPKPRTNHPSLYEPWLLLPPKESRAVLARGTHTVLPIVFSKNQNVKSGIHKLQRLLHAPKDDDQASDFPAALRDEGGVIAVSAQADGTVKLVGIVDMVRRIAGQTSPKAGAAEAGQGIKWFAYTVLSSVGVPRKTDPTGTAAGDEDKREAQVHDGCEPMDIDGHAGAVEAAEDGRNRVQHKTETKMAPVLTVWLSRERIPGFRDAFGEQELVVHNTEALVLG